ncbi:MAG TPA: glutamate 5-kinase [Spirochaetota bacterium]|nr:glutamate 5-kinase [Spirochaetota bacterium]HOL56693.1 glutamate 5-kinase [Spirochaetota bacterium]HPP05567.1 glutamate 5-kinase [Spirochaetota bacterium]
MKKIVVKISSNLLNPENEIDIVKKIAKEIYELKNKNYNIIIVTSGAVLHGLKKLNLDKKPDNIPLLQSCAAIGQIDLMERYKAEFKKYNIIPAQILVSTEDFNNRKRYLNLMNTINMLLSLNIIPIFNENDSINIEELKFGDNDHLSALITLMMNFDMLIILTDVDGLYDKDPKENSDAKLIKCINKVDESCLRVASNKVSKFSSGGMKAKIESSQKVANAGIDVFIGNGFKVNLEKIINNEENGTYIYGEKEKINARLRWIGFSPVNNAKIFIDEGAYKALVEKKSSLLAKGILKVEGNFSKGALVGIYFKDKKIAQGLTNYPSKDLQLIKGVKSEDFHKFIKNPDYEEVIHRNNMYLL